MRDCPVQRISQIIVHHAIVVTAIIRKKIHTMITVSFKSERYAKKCLLRQFGANQFPVDLTRPPVPSIARRHVPPRQVSHVIYKSDPTAALREQRHDQVRRKSRNDEMQKVELKAEIRLHHSDHNSVNMPDIVALRRRELTVEQT